MLANPKQVCTDLLRESKAERRELRKSLEARAHSSADIFVQAERSAREKRRMADDKPVSAAAAAEAARRGTQGLTCLRHGEKVKVRGMDSWRSGDPVRTKDNPPHACFYARSLRPLLPASAVCESRPWKMRECGRRVTGAGVGHIHGA